MPFWVEHPKSTRVLRKWACRLHWFLETFGGCANPIQPLLPSALLAAMAIDPTSMQRLLYPPSFSAVKVGSLGGHADWSLEQSKLLHNKQLM